jgi:SPP1 Gp6-like portal protein
LTTPFLALALPYAPYPIAVLPQTGGLAAAETPEWWRDRLLGKLFAPARVRWLRKLQRYYDGDHDLPALPEQAEEEFRRVLEICRANIMALVVDVTVERYGVVGFRFDDPDADDAAAGGQDNADVGPRDLSAAVGDLDAWAIWQANQMDAVFPQVIHEAVLLGSAFIMVAPNEDDGRYPLMTGEHPTECIVEYKPGSRRQRAAGLKAWRDDWTGEQMVTLFLPDKIYKWQTQQGQWVQRQVSGEVWPAPNPLGEVPLYEVAHNPTMLQPSGVSELADVLKDQDRINKTVLDRIMTQDYGAYPQRWALGFPKEDKEGNPTNVAWGRTRMVLNDVPKDQAAFGQWDAAPLSPYTDLHREDVRGIAARKRIPVQYLLGEMNNVNGQTLVASEVGLVAKTLQGQRPKGEAAEAGMRGAFRLRGDDRRGRDQGAETIWRDPQFRSLGELVDALQKEKALGIPDEVLWEKAGASPKEIRRWKAMRQDAAQRGGLGDLTALVTGKTLPTSDEAPGDVPVDAG